MKHLMLGVFISILFVSTSWSMSAVPSSTREMTVGRPAAAFTLETTERRQLSLAEAMGSKRVIMLFWATWCPHCHEELERIRQYAARIKEMGVGIILVNVGETREEAKAFLTRRGVMFESFVDEDNTVAGQYGVTGLPTLFLIDDKGTIRDVAHSFDPDALKDGRF